MSKIDLNKLMYKKGESVSYKDSPYTTEIAYTKNSVQELLKIVWNLAVDECKKAAKFKITKGNESGSFDLYRKNDFKISKDEESIEQVKQMIQ